MKHEIFTHTTSILFLSSSFLKIGAMHTGGTLFYWINAIE